MVLNQEEWPEGIKPLNNKSLTKNILATNANLQNLYNIGNESIAIGEKFVKDLNFFSQMVFDPFGTSLEYFPLMKEVLESKDTIMNIFTLKILQTAKKIAKNLELGLANKKGILFNGLLTSSVIKILESIIDFEKTIDKLFPGSSKKIINAFGNALIGLVGIHTPAVAIVIKASGAIDKVSNFLSAENLTKKVSDLKKIIHEVEQNEKLQNTYEAGIQIASIAEITGVSPLSLSNLGLNSESLSKITNLLEKDKDEESVKVFIQNIVATSELIPNNEKDLTKKLDSLKDSLMDIIKEQNLPEIVYKSFESKVNDSFKDIAIDAVTILSSDKSFFEKLICLQEVGSKVIESTKEFKYDLYILPNAASIESNINEKIMNLIKATINLGAAELLHQASKSPIIAKELGMNVQTKIFLERLVPKILGI